ncbi:MAG TPA: RNB domain-containing ribonuclease [Pelomicrobium sp.]|nr:RNB domain-containing ribonuclease [Pelomicrobium sp.]
MHVLYEESGAFKAGTILADNDSSLQVESQHGRRTKVKAGHVLLRYREPSPGELMSAAEALAQSMDPDFLWQCCGEGEFGFEALAEEYFGHTPSAVEAAGVLMRLHASPMYFYRKGKGRFKAAPEDALKAALASLERKRLAAEQQARYVEALKRCELPPEFAPLTARLLYDPDKQSIEYKALEQASLELKLSAPRLLERCGALASSRDYHLGRFLYEYFPRGTGFPELPPPAVPADLPLAAAQAFSIDDAATTEIDDAFSVTWLPGGTVRVGVHIAAPALAVTRGSPADAEARKRLSTVYLPGAKITMLPDAYVETFTLAAGRECPVLSMYLDVAEDTGEVTARTSAVERVHIAANLRHDALETQFNEDTIAAGRADYPYARELTFLWRLANRLQAARGKSDEGEQERLDYSFYVIDDVVRIVPRRRGAPVDKLVAELMIEVNQAWGGQIAEAGVPGLYRAQTSGPVRMTTSAAPHQGLGVAQYAWSSSPLRRYVDLVNQRQLAALTRGDPAPYPEADEELLAAMRDFELTYDAYAAFQRTMERYWCLRWLEQERVDETGAEVLREGLVRIDRIPLVGRVPSLPELPAGARVRLEITGVDLWELTFQARFLQREEAAGAGV